MKHFIGKGCASDNSDGERSVAIYRYKKKELRKFLHVGLRNKDLLTQFNITEDAFLQLMHCYWNMREAESKSVKKSLRRK